MKRFLKRLTAPLLALALALSATAGVGAENQGPEDQTELIAAAKLSDAEGLAEYAGISVTEALARNEDEAAVLDIGANLDPDKFAGVYFTQDSKGYTLHIVAKEGTDPAWPELPQLNVLKVVHETAPRSQTELLALRDSVAALAPTGFSEVVPNLTTGRVDVVATSAEAAGDITRQFGDAVTVTVGKPLETIACTNRGNCNPSRGGIFIATLSGDPDPGEDYRGCTFGFKAKGINTGVIKMLSAGHCNVDVSPTIYHPILDGQNTEICPGGSNTGVNVNSWGDYMKCGDGYFTATNSNIVLHDFGAGLAYPITTNRAKSSINNGNGCWMSGASKEDPSYPNQFSHVGSVAGAGGYYGIDWENHGIAFVQGFKCDYQMRDGDSGGPVYWNNGAMGIMTAKGDGYTVNSYTDAGHIDLALNIKLCLNYNCSN